MLKKRITYNDYKGGERTDDFYFDLNEAEITELELSKSGGLSKMLEDIVAAKDTTQLIPIFKELILKSYGEKSIDGLMFVKIDLVTGAPLYRKFMQTDAFNKLFMELSTDDNAAAEFFNGIMPQTPETQKAIAEAMEANGLGQFKPVE